MTAFAVIGLALMHWLNTGEMVSPVWLASALLVTALRGLLLVYHARHSRTLSVARKEILFIGPLLVTSVLWGIVPLLLFPSASAEEKLGITCIMSGLAGGGASVLAPLGWSARFYIFCALIPGAVLIYAMPGSGPVIAALGFCFFVVMMLSHGQARKILVIANTRLLENQTLLDDVRKQQAVVEQLNKELLTTQSALRENNQQLEQEIEERTARNRLAFSVIENTAEGVLVMGPQGTIIEVNPAFSRITGYASNEVIGKPASLMRSDRHDQSFFSRLWADLNTHGKWDGEMWSRHKNGSVFLERRSIDAVKDADGVVTHYVSVFNDVTENFRKDEQLRHLACHDPLTGLANRTLLLERLNLGISQATRWKKKLGVLFFDLDQFKSVNDTLGHHVGDLLLQEVGRRLKSCLRASDTLARLGGDEFVILMNEVSDGQDCSILANKLLAALARPVDVPGSRLYVRASLGISVFPDDGGNTESLMKNADMALYAAKAAGKNTFAFFHPTMSALAEQRLELEVALREAIADQQLSLHYQAKVDARSGLSRGYEALLRWQRPGHGYVSPERFIPVAEDSGLIDPIGNWVIAEACRQIAAWHRQGHGWQQIAVNVSAKQLLHDDLARLIEQAARDHDIRPGLLEIEVTESVVMSRPEKTMPILKALREMGVTIAVDDFGTGHSSLAYLRRLPIDVMKIDRAFVHEAEHDETAQAIIRTIVTLSKTLNLKVVAEGVETEAQVSMLRDTGCDMLQGYFFARPLAAADIENQWLNAAR